MNYAEIFDTSDGHGVPVVTVTLETILRLVPGWEQLEWRIREIEGTGDITDHWPAGIVDLAQTAASARNGVVLPSRNLMSIAHSVDQIINCEIIGFKAGTSEPVVIVRAIDSSLWRVETDDPGLLKAIAAQFHDVRFGVSHR
jgi:hypothetical protein